MQAVAPISPASTLVAFFKLLLTKPPRIYFPTRGMETLPMPLCEHLAHARYVAPKTHVCAECVKLGDTWVHLRTCLACGHVGCCDSSKNKHATKHFLGTQHPVIASAQPHERWLWCYVDEQMAE